MYKHSIRDHAKIQVDKCPLFWKRELVIFQDSLSYQWTALFIKKACGKLKYVFSFNLLVLVSSRGNWTFFIITFAQWSFKHLQTFLWLSPFFSSAKYTHPDFQLLFIKQSYHLGPTIFLFHIFPKSKHLKLSTVLLPAINKN